jgi:hypothetical protein
MGYKWVFIRKMNENNEVVRYKVRLMAQGFIQRSGVNFNETYSRVMGAEIWLTLMLICYERKTLFIRWKILLK